ncbi:hypothetical protein BDV95DRAFT_591810 [Massariosphaeria phaeospora]|uniref:RING-type domain-containing protein n=1 Tax=Massariosphaeria phaeospora TaxID=100035 RepID=A0A7C8IAZ9_9PLEO|nr:hypothetical protein BDV95DRAFT_591810 [Massariosphaeria phaeospora]
MGTLTGDVPRLDAHCPHKLATSCQLTATHNCCACADVRAHAATYSVYIDGVGFVRRGTRWQSYCWFCKEFWNNRLAATDPPLEAAQTQIPLIPDQTDFLERWFEFHQGYRIVRHADGTESHRTAVIGEPLSDVSPGFLPRTLDQLRTRTPNNASRPENRFRRRRLESEAETSEPPQQSIEDVLDRLLAEASEEEMEGTGVQEALPLDRQEIRPRRFRDRLDRVTRLFGTREDIQREDYESPVASMYNRAMDRYRRAEQQRAAEDTPAAPPRPLTIQEIQDRRRALEMQLDEQLEYQRILDDIAESRDDSAARIARLSVSFSVGAFSGLASPTTTAPPSTSISTTSPLASVFVEPTGPGSLLPTLGELEHLRVLTEATSAARLARHNPPPPGPSMTLDNQPSRPDPVSDEEMTRKLECRICYSQLADIAVLPCGHMVMCQWCADAVIPMKHALAPLRPTSCPMCRKSVKQRVKIHIG